ncbi:cardiolipin synthase [Sungkyunkwania multivorans]|uniref:Cardiolipin synthase n=1 Tax=Sungkyunkwania multivorans TaxID=1173618 RepID=A0ABW3D4H4_9FLAO
MTVAIIVIYGLITLWAIFNLILYGARPSKSLSWFVVILMLPFFGVLFYVLFGINRRKLKFFRLKQTEERQSYDLHLSAKRQNNAQIPLMSKKGYKLMKLITKNAGLYPYQGNEVTILEDGIKTFEMILKELQAARKFIHIQFYIFEEGELLERLCQVFEERIAAGVEVRIIYDAIGSLAWRRSSINRFKALGVQVFSSMPLRLGSILFTLNYRNHRKIIVIDGVVGFTGGVNVSDKYIRSTNSLGVWDDMHLCIKGPAINDLHRIFIKDYYFASDDKEDLLNERYLPKIPDHGKTIVQFVASGPDSNYSAIMQQYIMLINLAEDYICIANPYFIPSIAVIEALKMAALSGIKVKVLVPRKSDSSLVKHSMFSYFEELLSANIEIYLHREKFLHSKMMVIDDEIVSVGSSNFDHRSFEQNFEANAVVYDSIIARLVKEDFQNDCSESVLLDLETFKKRPIRHKLLEGFARMFSPLL